MQASSENEAEIYIYDEIGYWGVTAKQFVANLKALGDVTHINLHINSPVAMSLMVSPFLMP
jgi:ATP-dependent protease ClpP protease subunit